MKGKQYEEAAYRSTNKRYRGYLTNWPHSQQDACNELAAGKQLVAAINGRYACAKRLYCAGPPFTPCSPTRTQSQIIDNRTSVPALRMFTKGRLCMSAAKNGQTNYTTPRALAIRTDVP